jgi:hypothetical protein
MTAAVVGYILLEFLRERFWVSRLRKFQMFTLKVLTRVEWPGTSLPGYPPFFRYIRITGLAGILRKVFKNNDLYGKYSGIRT